MATNFGIYILSFFLFLALLGLGMGFLVLMGNLLAMKLLAKSGYALFSKNIKKDYKLLKFITNDGVGWLHIPGLIYAPIMKYKNGKYQNKNLFNKDNLYGELRLLETESIQHLKSMSLKSKYEIPDLSIIQGNPKGKIGSMRHTNFSELSKMKNYLESEETVKIKEKDFLRKFKVVSVTDMSLGDKHTINTNDRESFLKNIYENSKNKTHQTINFDKPALILQCRSKIDTILVLLIEE
jgi:hypothetical protein